MANKSDVDNKDSPSNRERWKIGTTRKQRSQIKALLAQLDEKANANGTFSGNSQPPSREELERYVNLYVNKKHPELLMLPNACFRPELEIPGEVPQEFVPKIKRVHEYIRLIESTLAGNRQNTQETGSAARISLPPAESVGRKGDAKLLQTDGGWKEAVTFSHAGLYLGVTVAQVRRLARKTKLAAVGQGRSRKIVVKSLTDYCKPEVTK